MDGTGIRVGKVIHTARKALGSLGSVVLISVKKRDVLKRRIRLGQVFKAILTSRGFRTLRVTGHMVYGTNTVVVIKKSDNAPISKRVKGPVPMELRYKKSSKVLSMGSYVF